MAPAGDIRAPPGTCSSFLYILLTSISQPFSPGAYVKNPV